MTLWHDIMSACPCSPSQKGIWYFYDVIRCVLWFHNGVSCSILKRAIYFGTPADSLTNLDYVKPPAGSFAAERKSTFEPLETTFALSYTLRVKRMGFALKRWLHWESSCGKWFRCTSRVQQITDQNLKRSQIISADPWKEDRFGLGWPRWSPSIAAVSLSLMLECDNWSRQKKGRPIPDWIQCCTVG